MPTRSRLALQLAAALLACGACGDSESQPPVDRAQPPDFLDELRLATLDDDDPDPHVLEVTLRASVSELSVVEGLTTPAWTYAGSLPGPLLRVTAGDRVVVHFENDLPEPTTVHWHGIRLPVAMDGSPHSQEPVEPGGSFTYDFVAPDPGLYWYHPHVHDAAQIGFGLYGALLVDPVEPAPADLGDEVVLVLSDISIDDDGALASPEQGGDIATLFGREGEDVLVNGKVLPTMHARNGQRQRWRVVNAAKSRYFLLGLTGHTFTRIGGHTGLLETPEQLDEVLLAPGDRADLLITPKGDEGAVEQLMWLPFDRGYGSTEFRPPKAILDLELVGAPLEELPMPALASEPFEPLDLEGAEPIEIHLTSEQDEEGKLHMGINGVPYDGMASVDATVGQTQVWTLVNDMEWDHPFHLHGFFFQALEEDGSARREWLDTLNVPRMQSTRFAVRYDNRPGMWMFHCHILDHADAGMMSMVDLRP